MTILRRAWPNLARDIVLNKLISSAIVPQAIRWKLYNLFGLSVERSVICPHVWFGSRNVSIGAGTFINYRCVFNTAGGISIGSDCDIAIDVAFVTSSHELGGPARRAGAPTVEPIRVGNGVWIGARALILPGVTIGDGAVVAAGAVVTGDIAPHSVYAGVPARPLKGYVLPS